MGLFSKKKEAAPALSYAQWCELIDGFSVKKNEVYDAAVVAKMKSANINWQSGVAERFVSKLSDALTARLKSASERFHKDMSNSNGQERGVVLALTALRKELAFLLDAVSLPALPEDTRESFVGAVRSQAESMQESLEKSAKETDRSGKLSSIVRNHKITL